ncbi:MAG: bile acid:sodium symporter family protein [Puniceicoccaceae bacterium]
MKRFFGANAFVLGVLAAVGLAALRPSIGAGDGVLPVGILKTTGIVGIFFFQGLVLPFEALRGGLGNWRLHLCSQIATFVFFPLATVAGLAATAAVFTQPDLRMGFLYLAILPTTIASAVGFTAVAGGNVAGALFNTTLSNVAGVFLVPILCLGVIGAGGAGEGPPVGPVLGRVFLTILLPLVIGQILRSVIGGRIDRRKGAIRRFNTSVILFMVYAAFCESFARDTWANLPAGLLAGAAAGVLALLAAGTAYAWISSGWFGLERSSRITALMCGGQKTLAVGLPLSVMIFGTGERGIDPGLLLLPLLLYHPAQLLLAGWVAPRLGRGR